jgi:myo-inositol 2-dehydrogenase/D-chiro-inositol 1-dehydrogenase
MHIHDYDVVSWVLGQDIVEVYAKGAVLVDPMFSRNNDFDTVAAMLTFSDGTLGVLTGARHDPVGHDVRLELFGSRNSVVADGTSGRR